MFGESVVTVAERVGCFDHNLACRRLVEVRESVLTTAKRARDLQKFGDFTAKRVSGL